MSAIKAVLFEYQIIINDQFPELYEDDRQEKEFALLGVAGSLFERDYDQAYIDLYDYYSDFTDADNPSILKAIDSVIEKAKVFKRKLFKRFQVIRDCGQIQIMEFDGLVVHRFDERGNNMNASLYDLDENDFDNLLDEIEILFCFDRLQEAVNYASKL